MFQVAFALSKLAAFAIITTKYSQIIFRKTKHWSCQNHGKKIFTLISTISSHPFSWFFTGKALQTTGEFLQETGLKRNSTIIRMSGSTIVMTGQAMAVPASFVLSTQHKLPLISKATQGFLISLNPFEIVYYLVFTNQTLPINLNTSATKGFKWGVRDFIELALAPVSQFKALNKLIGVVITEQSISSGIKTVIREMHEQKLLESWTKLCPELEKQTPYIISNALYPVSLDPVFDFLNQVETCINATFSTQNSSLQTSSSVWECIINVSFPAQNSAQEVKDKDTKYANSLTLLAQNPLDLEETDSAMTLPGSSPDL